MFLRVALVALVAWAWSGPPIALALPIELALGIGPDTSYPRYAVEPRIAGEPSSFDVLAPLRDGGFCGVHLAGDAAVVVRATRGAEVLWARRIELNGFSALGRGSLVEGTEGSLWLSGTGRREGSVFPDRRVGWVARLDHQGALSWVRSTSRSTSTLALQALANGECLLSTGASGDGVFLRLSADGSQSLLRWIRREPPPGDPYTYSFESLDSVAWSKTLAGAAGLGGSVVAGRVQANDLRSALWVAVVMIDDGYPVFVRAFTTGPGVAGIQDVSVASLARSGGRGAAYAVGASWVDYLGAQDQYAVVLGLGASLERRWGKRLADPYARIVNVAAHPDGGVLVGTNLYGGSRKTFRITHFDADGTVLWERVLGPGSAVPRSLHAPVTSRTFGGRLAVRLLPFDQAARNVLVALDRPEQQLVMRLDGEAGIGAATCGLELSSTATWQDFSPTEIDDESRTVSYIDGIAFWTDVQASGEPIAVSLARECFDGPGRSGPPPPGFEWREYAPIFFARDPGDGFSDAMPRPGFDPACRECVPSFSPKPLASDPPSYRSELLGRVAQLVGSVASRKDGPGDMKKLAKAVSAVPAGRGFTEELRGSLHDGLGRVSEEPPGPELARLALQALEAIDFDLASSTLSGGLENEGGPFWDFAGAATLTAPGLDRGRASLTLSPGLPAPSGEFLPVWPRVTYELRVRGDARATGPVEVAVYAAGVHTWGDLASLRLYRWSGEQWEDCTIGVDLARGTVVGRCEAVGGRFALGTPID